MLQGKTELEDFKDAKWGLWRKPGKQKALELESPEVTFKKQSQIGWYALVLPALGKPRQTDIWGSLATESGLFGKHQASEILCLKKQGGFYLTNDILDCSPFPRRVHTCA